MILTTAVFLLGSLAWAQIQVDTNTIPSLEAALLEEPKAEPAPLPAVERASHTVTQALIEAPTAQAPLEDLIPEEVEASTGPVAAAPSSEPLPAVESSSAPFVQAPIEDLIPEATESNAAPMPSLGDESEELAPPDGRAPKKFWVEKLLGTP